MERKTSKRPYHHGSLHEALVTAGMTILREGDLEKFTLRECARRAGVSHAAPKNHFTSLDDLKAEICARGFEQLISEQEVAAAPHASAEARLIAMGHAYVRFACANPAIYMMMFRDLHAFAKTAHYREASEASWAQIRAAVAAVLGPGRQPEAELRAAHAWALVHGFASLVIDGRLPPGLETDAVIAEALLSFARSLPGLGTA